MKVIYGIIILIAMQIKKKYILLTIFMKYVIKHKIVFYKIKNTFKN